MALQMKRRDSLPEDAVILSKDEALKYQVNLMNSCKNQWDTFAYRTGTSLLGGLSMFSGLFVNNFYRGKLKLRHYGRVTSYLPIVAIPVLSSMGLHTAMVLEDVLLQKSCPVCTEIRAAALQTVTGCIIPTILAPLSSFSLAVQYNTHRIPYITQEPWKVFEFWRKITRPIGNTLFALLIANALAGCLITYFEAKSVRNVHHKLLELEKKVLAEYG